MITMSEQILSITEINSYIRDKMDNDRLLCSLAVRGEISNYKIYPSGHHYFTLKDENASLRCVMFKGNTFRLRFHPENGMQVIATGKISVYPRDGCYQLYCTAMTVDGVGDLYAAFEQLKTKLAAKGMFDPAHKKPIPRYPKTIGIVTSSAGAAIHDILPRPSTKLAAVRRSISTADQRTVLRKSVFRKSFSSRSCSATCVIPAASPVRCADGAGTPRGRGSGRSQWRRRA